MRNDKLIAYTVHTRDRDGRKFWTRLGDALVQRDGSIVIELRALPVDGTIVLRSTEPAAETPATTPADFVGTLAWAYLEAPEYSYEERELERLVSVAERHGIDHERVLETLGHVRALEEP